MYLSTIHEMLLMEDAKHKLANIMQTRLGFMLIGLEESDLRKKKETLTVKADFTYRLFSVHNEVQLLLDLLNVYFSRLLSSSVVEVQCSQDIEDKDVTVHEQGKVYFTGIANAQDTKFSDFELSGAFNAYQFQLVRAQDLIQTMERIVGCLEAGDTATESEKFEEPTAVSADIAHVNKFDSIVKALGSNLAYLCNLICCFAQGYEDLMQGTMRHSGDGTRNASKH